MSNEIEYSSVHGRIHRACSDPNLPALLVISPSSRPLFIKVDGIYLSQTSQISNLSIKSQISSRASSEITNGACILYPVSCILYPSFILAHHAMLRLVRLRCGEKVEKVGPGFFSLTFYTRILCLLYNNTICMEKERKNGKKVSVRSIFFLLSWKFPDMVITERASEVSHGEMMMTTTGSFLSSWKK